MKIIELAERYTNEIYLAQSATLLPSDKKEEPQADISIETGMSGKLLFLIEFYHHCPKKEILDFLAARASFLTNYLKSGAGRNWSLYTGNAGILYTLFHIYLLNEDENILASIMEIVKEADDDFLQSEYVSDYLYDGRAGTLLTLFGLYRGTGRTDLCPHIDKYLKTVISNARYTDEGIYWKQREEVVMRPSCGMALGTSGVKYVLSLMNSTRPCEALGFLMNGINAYRDSCWVEKLKNWGNFERGIHSEQELKDYTAFYHAGSMEIFEPDDNPFYQNGTAGLVIADRLVGPACGIMYEKLRYLSVEACNTSLLSGVTGIGLVLLEDKSNKPLPYLEAITRFVYEQVSVKATHADFDFCLLKGDLGAVYFLLKTLGSTNSENVLFPFSHFAQKENVHLDLPDLDYTGTRRTLLGKTFYRSLGVLDMADAAAFGLYCEETFTEDTKGEITRFTRYLEQAVARMPENPNTWLLKDIFTLEKKKNEFFLREKMNGLAFYLERTIARNNSLEFLNQQDEIILACKIGHSDSYTTLKTKWNWSFYKDMQYEKAQLESGKFFEYLFYFSPEKEKVEVPLHLAGMVMHQFDYPRFIGDAIEELKLMLRMLPSYILTEYAAVVGSSTIEDFMNRIDYLLLTFIKQMVYEGFLETKSVIYEFVI